MKKVLIVGGSKGIGAEILRMQIEQNEVINLSRTSPEISSGRLKHYTCDILEDELPDLEQLDSLVYCPGSINLKSIRSLTEEDYYTDLNINVMGAIKTFKKYLPLLKKSEQASVVFFSSVAVGQGMPFHSSVAVAKGALEGLTRSLAAEFAPVIRVNCIAPSITHTPLAARILRNEKAIESISAKHPLKRISTASDIASLADFLINSLSLSITGQIIKADNGMSSINLS